MPSEELLRTLPTLDATVHHGRAWLRSSWLFSKACLGPVGHAKHNIISNRLDRWLAGECVELWRDVLGKPGFDGRRARVVTRHASAEPSSSYFPCPTRFALDRLSGGWGDVDVLKAVRGSRQWLMS